MIWNQEYETMSEEKIRDLQSRRLVDLVNRVYENVPFYKEKFDQKGITPAAIKSIDDIVKLPFTTKQEMRQVYPYGLLAVPVQELEEVHMSSGTTGTPVVAAYTKNDIELWSEVMARALCMGGITSRDTIHNAYGYGLFTGGLGVHYGARRIGANIIPISGGNTKRQLKVLKDFQGDAITCTPSYCLYLAEAAREAGIDFSELALRVGFFGAEPWSENMRQEIEQKLSLEALDIYGLTEIIGPGVAQECQYKNGLHVFEDAFFPEIIDPHTQEPLPDGEKGELVITTLTREGTPIIRYRVRDITCLSRGRCHCGRTQVRMHRLMGRSDDMLIIRGVNVFPSQIEQVLFNIEGIEPHYQIVINRQDQLDSIEVQVEMNEAIFSDEIKRLAIIEEKIKQELYSVLSIHASVKLREPKSLPRSEGKARRVIDNRQI